MTIISTYSNGYNEMMQEEFADETTAYALINTVPPPGAIRSQVGTVLAGIRTTRSSPLNPHRKQIPLLLITYPHHYCFRCSIGCGPAQEERDLAKQEHADADVPSFLRAPKKWAGGFRLGGDGTTTGGEDVLGSVAAERTRVIPVYVFSLLGLDAGTLLDHRDEGSVRSTTAFRLSFD